MAFTGFAPALPTSAVATQPERAAPQHPRTRLPAGSVGWRAPSAVCTRKASPVAGKSLAPPRAMWDITRARNPPCCNRATACVLWILLLKHSCWRLLQESARGQKTKTLWPHAAPPGRRANRAAGARHRFAHRVSGTWAAMGRRGRAYRLPAPWTTGPQGRQPLVGNASNIRCAGDRGRWPATAQRGR